MCVLYIYIYTYIFYLISLFFEMESHSVAQATDIAVMLSQLIATSASQSEVILWLQPPK